MFQMLRRMVSASGADGGTFTGVGNDYRSTLYLALISLPSNSSDHVKTHFASATWSDDGACVEEGRAAARRSRLASSSGGDIARVRSKFVTVAIADN
jgi:hypothetical protein